ncbi:hypothetical protein [Celeribacter naphthalenivorans]|uniref:hypothetical protein n=1 Tax=Celeribacter naphthalenivorans TaxID=1614694 RepID=UPI001CFC3083|nr:hypothetical protein [Celeribacter naphthalenivorans]
MGMLLLIQALSLVPNFPAPPPSRGRVHPIVLIVTTAIAIDLLQRLLNLRNARLRHTSYFSYGAPLLVVFIILRLAEPHGKPIGHALTLVDARRVTLSISLMTLSGFLLLSLVPILGRLRPAGAWIHVLIFAALGAAHALRARLAHDLGGPDAAEPFGPA